MDFRKILVSAKFVSAILGPFYGHLEKCVLSAGKTMSVKFPFLGGGGVWGGGSADFIFMGARIFLRILNHGIFHLRTVSYYCSACASRVGLSAPKIAHRRSLATLPQTRVSKGTLQRGPVFTHFLRRKNRGSLAVFFAEQIAHPGASKNRATLGGAVKIAAAAAENRAILVRRGVGLSTKQTTERTISLTVLGTPPNRARTNSLRETSFERSPC